MKIILFPILLLPLTLLLVAGTDPRQSLPAEKSTARPPDTLLKFHAAHVTAFVESPGRGATRTVQPPMWASQMMSIALPETGILQTIYRREQFSLVGLLSRATPLAYTTATSPHGQPIRGPLPTRALDEFESVAVDRLMGGETLVVSHESDGTLRMMGSLLARAECIQCHDDKNEGDLLGAFSYRLAPTSAPTRVESAPPSRQPPRP
jgi:hypothetical protein